MSGMVERIDNRDQGEDGERGRTEGIGNRGDQRDTQGIEGIHGIDGGEQEIIDRGRKYRENKGGIEQKGILGMVEGVNRKNQRENGGIREQKGNREGSNQKGRNRGIIEDG